MIGRVRIAQHWCCRNHRAPDIRAGCIDCSAEKSFKMIGNEEHHLVCPGTSIRSRRERNDRMKGESPTISDYLWWLKWMFAPHALPTWELSRTFYPNPAHPALVKIITRVGPCRWASQ